MKKIRTLNFITLQSKINYRMGIKLFWFSVLLFMIFEVYIEKSKLLEIETYINNQNNNNITERSIKSITDIKTSDKIESLYKVLGNDNILSVNSNDKYISVEGICENLDKLKLLKSQSNIKFFEVEKIIKQDNMYTYKISCDVGDVSETE